MLILVNKHDSKFVKSLKHKYNRFVTSIYHKVFRVRSNYNDFSHLEECNLCRKAFEKWKERDDE